VIGYQESETLRVFRRCTDIAYDDADVSRGWLDKTNFVKRRILLLTNKFTFSLPCAMCRRVGPFSSSLDSVLRLEDVFFYLQCLVKANFQ